MRYSIALTLLALLLSTPYLAMSSEELPGTVPNWMMSSLEGEQVSLYSELEQGNSVVMVFWATWCKFCQELLPEINSFNLSEKTEKVRIFALNIWEHSDPAAYLREHNLSLTTIPGADSIAKQFKVRGTPGVITISPDKKITYRRKSGETTAEVISALRSL